MSEQEMQIVTVNSRGNFGLGSLGPNGGTYMLYPGVNEVPKNVWEEAKKRKAVIWSLKSMRLVEGYNQGPPPDPFKLIEREVELNKQAQAEQPTQAEQLAMEARRKADRAQEVPTLAMDEKTAVDYVARLTDKEMLEKIYGSFESGEDVRIAVKAAVEARADTIKAEEANS